MGVTQPADGSQFTYSFRTQTYPVVTLNTLCMDDLFDAFANVHRRRLLAALLEHDPKRDTIDVPEDVHEGEKDLESLRLAFYHSHLPRLADADIVRWDRETHDVRKGPRFDEIRPLLKLVGDDVNELPDDWGSPQRVSQPGD